MAEKLEEKAEERRTIHYSLEDGTTIGLFYEDKSWKHYEQDYFGVRWYGPYELTSRDKQNIENNC